MGLLESRKSCFEPYRTHGRNRNQHRHSQTIYSLCATVSRNSVAQYDVQHEKDAIRKCEQIAEWFAAESDTGENPTAAGRKRQRYNVAWRARPERCQRNWSDKFNSTYCAQRQSRDGLIKTGVHKTQHNTERK